MLLCRDCALSTAVLEVVLYMLEVVNGVRCVLWVLGFHALLFCMLFCMLFGMLFGIPFCILLCMLLSTLLSILDREVLSDTRPWKVHTMAGGCALCARDAGGYALCAALYTGCCGGWA